MGETFNDIKIDTNIEWDLNAGERKAIEGLKDIDNATLKTALTSDEISVVNAADGTTTTSMKLIDMITAIEENADWAAGKLQLKAGKTEAETPIWINNLINDTDSNDLIYFINLCAINLSDLTGTASEVFDTTTKDNLAKLKTEIEKTDSHEPWTSTLNFDKVTKIYFKGKKEMLALKSEIEWLVRQNKDVIQKAVFDYIDKWEIDKLQEYLYKQNGWKDQMNSRTWTIWDGKFGPGTLRGIEAIAKLEKEKTEEELKDIKDPVKKEKSPIVKGDEEKEPADDQENWETPEDYTITMYGKPIVLKLNKTTRETLDKVKELFPFEKVFWHISQSFQADDEWNLTSFPLKYEFIQKIKSSFDKDAWKKEVDLKGVPYTTIESYINELPLNDLIEKIMANPPVIPKEGSQESAKVNTGTTVNNTEDITKPMEETMYNTWIDTIEDIKTSELIEKFKGKYPLIGECFTGITTFSIQANKNPYFQITYKDANKTTAKTEQISMRELMDPKTHVFDKNSLFNKILDGTIIPILGDIEKNKKQEALLAVVLWKTFTHKYLFGDAHKDDEYYKQYFALFENSEIKIDDSPTYTKIEDDTLKFRLDNKKADKDMNKDKSLALSLITDANGELNKANFKTEMAKIVENIIEVNYWT